MRSVIIGLIGSVTLWGVENVTLVIQIIIGLVTVGAIVYEKYLVKNRCSKCLYYIVYSNKNEQSGESNINVTKGNAE